MGTASGKRMVSSVRRVVRIDIAPDRRHSMRSRTALTPSQWRLSPGVGGPKVVLPVLQRTAHVGERTIGTIYAFVDDDTKVCGEKYIGLTSREMLLIES